VQRVVVQLRAAIKSLGARLKKGANAAAILRQVRQVSLGRTEGGARRWRTAGMSGC
jgi:hypothetical protein